MGYICNNINILQDCNVSISHHADIIYPSILVGEMFSFQKLSQYLMQIQPDSAVETL